MKTIARRSATSVVCALAAAGILGVARTIGSSTEIVAPRPTISSDTLTAEQIDNLTLLGKVWGFAKYHHPRITRGELDWDAELRRVLPVVVDAKGHVAGTAAISAWLGEVGAPELCGPCATMTGDRHLTPDIEWIRDERRLGRELATQLQQIHQNRRMVDSQHYVWLVRGIGNPVFLRERLHGFGGVPGLDVRLLALYRFWNIIEYWFPYRDVIGADWDGVLREFVPRLWSADSRDAYRLAMVELVARVNDGHANLESAYEVRPPGGIHGLPVTLRFVEGKAVVTGYSNDTLGPATGLRVGDVILSIGGARVDSLVAAWQPYYGASNQTARLHAIAWALTHGPSGPVRVTGERDGKAFATVAERVRFAFLNLRAGGTHDLPGETLQMLSPDVAYLKLSSVSAAQAAEYIQRASGAKVLVIDIRNYPREFMVFALGRRLVSVRTEFARFTVADPANPGAFRWTSPVVLMPELPRFEGKVVILVDESSISQSEYTAMAFRAAPNALVVGSTTAGADGNVSQIPLPGGLRAAMSGIGVFYPDRRPTQRVGIVPDLVVRPTIAGIRQRRDEVLEAAVSHALGRDFRLAGKGGGGP